MGEQTDQVGVYGVAGGFEIPLWGLGWGESGKLDAIIWLGTIIGGQTPHFDWIAGEVARGIADAGMDSGLPVVFGIVRLIPLTRPSIVRGLN